MCFDQSRRLTDVQITLGRLAPSEDVQLSESDDKKKGMAAFQFYIGENSGLKMPC